MCERPAFFPEAAEASVIGRWENRGQDAALGWRGTGSCFGSLAAEQISGENARGFSRASGFLTRREEARLGFPGGEVDRRLFWMKRGGLKIAGVSGSGTGVTGIDAGLK